MADSKKSESKKSSMSPLVGLGIGCLVILVVFGIVASLAMRFFAKRIGTSLVQSVIENKTGVKTNLQDLEQGKLSFTDNKTGQKLDIGSGKLPDSFPKDFPIYPGSTVVSAISGNQVGQGNGFYIIFSTKDASSTVLSYYKSHFKTNGWAIDSTTEMGGISSLGVSKGKQEGTLVVSVDSGKGETGIAVTLSEKSETTTPEETP
jgi:hypothetical protein